MRRGDGRADRRGDAVRPRAVRPDRGDARRRRGAAARAGGHPRARQRAGPHRVGGLRDGDPRRGRGRRDHDRGHAAELGAADDDARRPGREACGGRGPVLRRRRVLGRRGAGERRRHAGPARGGGLRLQVLPARLGCRGVRVAGARGVRRGDVADRRAGRADDRARGGRDAGRRGLAERRVVRRVPGVAATGRGGGGDLAGGVGGPVDRGARARGAPVGRGRGPCLAGGPRVRGAGDGGDLPALPDLRRRARRRRRDRAQVLPADPRGREP